MVTLSTGPARLKAATARLKKPPLSRTPHLCGCPGGRGLVVRVSSMSPKKPNSAIRHVAKVRLYSKPRVTARIPGKEFQIMKFNRALVRGGRANDLPGVGYSLVRGRYDFSPFHGKKRRRSFYGVKRPEHLVVHVRRKARLKAAGMLGLMPSDLTLVFALLLSTLCLACSQAWAYVLLLALLEVCWAAACYAYARLSLLGLDLPALFWAFAWLLFAAVELALSALALIGYAQSTGQATLA